MKNLKNNGNLLIFLNLIIISFPCYCMQANNSAGSANGIAFNVSVIDPVHHKALVQSYLLKFVTSRKVRYAVLKYIWDYPNSHKSKQVKRYMEMVMNTCMNIRKREQKLGNQLGDEFERAIEFTPSCNGHYDYILTGNYGYLRGGSLCEVMTSQWDAKLKKITARILLEIDPNRTDEYEQYIKRSINKKVALLQAKADHRPFASSNIQP